MEVSQTATGGDRHLQHDPGGEGVEVVEVVEEGAVGMVLRDEPEFRNPVVGYHVAGKEPQDVVVTKEDGVVDLGLSEPRVLVARGKLFHGYQFALVVAHEHLVWRGSGDGCREQTIFG